MTHARIALALLALASVAGCSGNVPVPVSGTVTLDGLPVEGAGVTFYRTEGGKEGRAAGGRTDASGRYQLGTLTDTDGAFPGDYVVVVSRWVSAKPNVQVPDFPDTPEGRFERSEFLYKAYGDGPRMKSDLPTKYGSVESSPFKVTIQRGMTMDLPLTTK